MDMRWIVRGLFVAALVVGNLAHAMEPPFHTPTTTLYQQDFEGVHGIPTSWQVALGTWGADGQTYNSTTASSTALTTIFEYQSLLADGTFETIDYFPYGPFTLSARLRNQGSSASSLVGLVYFYVDPANYLEVVFSPTGVAYLRRVFDGQMETQAAATYPGAGQGVWFRVEVELTGGTSVRVNGVPVFINVPQPVRGDTQGQMGLSTYNTTGRFNKISISIPYGQQPFTEDFSDGAANGFVSPQGTFVVSNGTYIDTAVQRIGQASAPIDFGERSTMVAGYAMHVRMFNPYGNPGNLVGLIYDDGIVDGRRVYQEVVFTAGVAQLRRHVGSTIQVLNTASHTVGPKTWFTVTLVARAGGINNEISVAINGRPLFTHEPVEWIDERPYELALVTHWTPGRFDDFVFDDSRPGPVVASRETFDSGVAASDVRSGTWNTQGGTLNNVWLNDEPVGAADVVLPGDHHGRPDYSYSGRLLNQWGNSGNQIGLVFSWDSAEDYLEVVFAQTGQAYLNLHMEGTRYRLATATHHVPQNVWFNVEVLRRGTTATVRLNGSPLFQNVQIGQQPLGSFGVVCHFSLCHFDNLALREVVSP